MDSTRPNSVGGKRRSFLFVLIKPSHYGEDGYVIRWWRTVIPANSLHRLSNAGSDRLELLTIVPK